MTDKEQLIKEWNSHITTIPNAHKCGADEIIADFILAREEKWNNQAAKQVMNIINVTCELADASEDLQTAVEALKHTERTLKIEVNDACKCDQEYTCPFCEVLEGINDTLAAIGRDGEVKE